MNASGGPVLDAAPDPIVTTDARGSILHANPAAERAFGAVLGRHLGDLLRPEDRQPIQAAFLHFLKTGDTGFLERRRDATALGPDGTTFPCELSIHHLNRSEPSIFAAYFRDGSERRQLELALRQAREDLSREVGHRTARRLDRAQAVARMGFVDVDRRLGTRVWSPEMFALFAFPPASEPPTVEEMLSRVHPLDQDRLRTLVDRSYAGGGLPDLIEFRIVLPDGQVRWIRNVSQPEAGDADRIMSIYLDVTDLKEAQEAERRRTAELASAVERLERTRQRLESAQRLGRMGDAERFLGEPHRVWSREMLLLHGFPPDEPTPARDVFLARVHPEDRAHLLTALQRADAGEDIPAFDYRIVMPSGQVRWLRVHTEITRDPMRGRVRVASSTLDVTEAKAVELETGRALERERELGRLKADFLHMVTHEYRTPLGIIVSAAQILERYHDRLSREERAAQLADIRSGARRLADLMEEILFLGKAEAGSIPLELEPIDCGAVVRDVVREVLTTFPAGRDVCIDTRGASAATQADHKLVRHILGNLVSNALKYSPSDRPPRVVASGDETAVEFIVSDDGIGIPARDQPRIFEMFRRGTNVGAVSGTGLGLVVVKRCVDLHGGTLELHSVENEGTRITVRLPCSPGVPHRLSPAFPP